MKKKQSREKIAAVREKDLAFVFGSDHQIWTDGPLPSPIPASRIPPEGAAPRPLYLSSS